MAFHYVIVIDRLNAGKVKNILRHQIEASRSFFLTILVVRCKSRLSFLENKKMMGKWRNSFPMLIQKREKYKRDEKTIIFEAGSRDGKSRSDYYVPWGAG